MTSGLYVHIPFCEQRCHYCAFTVAVTREAAYEPYVKRLTQEIAGCGIRGADTVYLGGGTPSLLSRRCLRPSSGLSLRGRAKSQSKPTRERWTMSSFPRTGGSGSTVSAWERSRSMPRS